MAREAGMAVAGGVAVDGDGMCAMFSHGSMRRLAGGEGARV
jgi:hypothetical protein